MAGQSKRGPASVPAPILNALSLADVALEGCNDAHGDDEVREARRALSEALPLAQTMYAPETIYDLWPSDPSLQISRVAQELIHASGKWPHTPDTEQALRLAVARAVGALQSIRLVPTEAYPRHVGRRLL